VRTTAIMFLTLTLAAGAAGQEAGKQSSDKPKAPAAEQAPQVPPQVREQLLRLQMRAEDYAQDIALLQEKADSVQMQIARVVQQLQQSNPDWELTPQLTFVKKQQPSPERGKP